jgi:hypothetical protein
MSGSTLKPAADLARANDVRFLNESAEYRRAREQLLAEEIELRRQPVVRRGRASTCVVGVDSNRQSSRQKGLPA